MAATVEEPRPHDGTCDECAPGEARVGGPAASAAAAATPRRTGAAPPRTRGPAAAPREPAGLSPGSSSSRRRRQEEEEEDQEEEEDPEEEEEEDQEEEEDPEEEEEEEEDEEEEEEEEEQQQQQRSPGGVQATGDTEEGPKERHLAPEMEVEAEGVARGTCPELELDLSAYYRQDQQLICTLCPVVGAHRGHRLATLHEAFEERRSKDSGRLKAAVIELVERLRFKSSDPNVSRDQMKVFIQQEFNKVQKVIATEEQRTLHLVNIQEAMDTAHVTEILADIQSHMYRLMTQMAKVKEQQNTSNKAAELY
ncbi:tripartite motif-containing protein 44 [Sorex araneus]|uniref:tripartite motif-containing protein 44 n=1 Tax=Sorex araneus TaxID=42254 RepID=UPI002433E316|nr:tripartite motif-containing protein 44 [Sorex araneus]